MDLTNWKIPPTADGKTPDVRAGDEWRINPAGRTYAICGAMRVDAIGRREVAGWAEEVGYNCIAVCNLAALISRAGIPWNVPEAERKGRWMAREEVPIEAMRFIPGDKGDMCWVPSKRDRTSPSAGEVWRKDGLVYLPIMEGSLRIGIETPKAGFWGLGDAPSIPGFAGYSFPTKDRHAICSGSVLYMDAEGDLHVSMRSDYTIVRATHVVIAEEK